MTGHLVSSCVSALAFLLIVLVRPAAADPIRVTSGSIQYERF